MPTLAHPPVLSAYAELSELASQPARQAYVQARKAEFETRTGTFAVQDAWHEARMRAFHDDLVTQVDFHATLPGSAEPSVAKGRSDLLRAFRGLFRLRRGGSAAGDGFLVVNIIDHAEYYVTLNDAFLRQALDAIEEAVFDARITASDRVLSLLPGAFVHPEDATQAIEGVVRTGVARGIECGVLLDALLRMEHQLRVRSRVRASQVYRVESLAPGIDAQGRRAI